jgi:carboxyl-terminal processing protease
MSHRLARAPIALAVSTGVTCLVGVGVLLGCGGDEPAAPQTSVDRPILLADTGSVGVREAIHLATLQDPGDQMVNADTLKRRAIDTLKRGEFDEVETLLDQALRLRPDDRSLRQMDDWVERFREHRDRAAEERQEAFEDQVAEVRLLQENGYRSYAINATNIAYQLAADADAFAAEPWVIELVEESRGLAEEYEANGQWIRAMRVWGDLASIESLNPVWKDRLEGATRRVRLLATFAPEILEEIRTDTQAERQAVEKLLTDARIARGDAPATRPATRPSADADDNGDSLDEEFRSDWNDGLEGISMSMLRDALDNARQGYVRPVEFRDMLLGGIDAVEAIATTPGLERAFETLRDQSAKDAFISALATQRAQLEATDPSNVDRRTAAGLLRALAVANDRSLELPETVIVSEFADGSLGTLDPFTSMIWPSQVAEFKKGTQGSFVGVGIQIRSEPTGDLRVVSPLPGGPASESGIRYGDVITHIDAKSAHGISDSQAVEVITGEPGTAVTLTIRSENGDVKDHRLIRRPIKVSSVKGWLQVPDGDEGEWDFVIDDDAQIGYVRISNFQNTTAAELADALARLRRDGAQAVILDLRYNPGGLLQSAVEVADRFLPGDVIVSTKSERENARESSLRARRQGSDILGLPMVVLVNEYSASASEIVSGALKDLDRALVVGKRTFGKGSVQMLYRLGGRGDSEAWLKLTTSHYYLPSGKNIHKEELDTDWGVDPDVPVEMTPGQMRRAQIARQQLDILRDDDSQAVVTQVEDGIEEEVDAREALLEADTQLSAALLLLRMQLAGEAVM